jgi:hypothetical protein
LLVESTNASRLGEFLSKGDWHIIGSFLIIDQYTVTDGNGNYKVIPEQVIGEKRGENFRSCYFCGTPINEHITFRDNISKREVNIGNVCVDKLGDAIDEKELLVFKGLKSVKDKVAREFKKKIHRKDMLDFLDANMDKWQKKVNDEVDVLLKKDPKAFYNAAEKTIVKNNKEFVLKTTAFEQKQGSDAREFAKRNPIKTLRDSFELRGWNVKPLIEEFEKLITAQGFNDKIPKPRRLTKAELDQLAKETQINVDQYLNRGKSI